MHVIPHGIFSSDNTISVPDLPKPPVLYDSVGAGRAEARGKYKIKHVGGDRLQEEFEGYGLLRNDGFFETVNTSHFRNDEQGRTWVNPDLASSVIGLDPALILALKDASSQLNEMGFSGVASMTVSLLDAADVHLHADDAINGSLINRPNPPSLGTDFYMTDPVTIQLGDSEIIADIEPVLDEIWRQFGYGMGTLNVEDGEWAKGSITISGETLLEEGDR